MWGFEQQPLGLVAVAGAAVLIDHSGSIQLVLHDIPTGHGHRLHLATGVPMPSGGLEGETGE